MELLVVQKDLGVVASTLASELLTALGLGWMPMLESVLEYALECALECALESLHKKKLESLVPPARIQTAPNKKYTIAF